jgi:deoxycytidylate deaminase
MLLRKREAINVLRDYVDNNFAYISMTDVLIKCAIESVGSGIRLDRGNRKFKILRGLIGKINSNYPDIKQVKSLNGLIRNRRFHDFTRKDFLTFEKHLKKIRQTRQQVPGWLHNDNDLMGELLQDFGDNLRRCGNPWDYETKYNVLGADTVFSLAEEANDIVKFFRSRERENKTGETRIKQFVIEAFRNPSEIEFFRNRYYEFYLISIFADYEVRRAREKFSENRDRRDRGEDVVTQEFYKQNVSECVRISDIAINNEKRKKDLFEKLSLYFALIKQPGSFSPEWEETAMHMAYSMSVRSTCICRQAGAVIEGENGYIIGAGWNDVGAGQIGCGYRHYRDFKDLGEKCLVSNPHGEGEFREKLKRLGQERSRDAFCFKDEYGSYIIRKKLFRKIMKERQDELKKLDRSQKETLAQDIERGLNLKIMQYCRALHAEENAILQTSVIGGMGVNGGKIYTTTYPCELCAKKIYQANIKKVVYTEPYPRSISRDVFFQDGTRKIEFDQFEGVKSQSYFRLYKAVIDKKEFQILKALA